MLLVLKPILMTMWKSRAFKELIVAMLEKIVARTDNDLDDLAVKVGNKPLKLSTLQAINGLYNFTGRKNAEILYRYCELAIPSEDTSVLPVAVKFITTQGRMKFVRPLYRALYKSKMGKSLAVETFLENKDFYHPIGVKMIAIDLNVEKKAATTMTMDPWLVGGALLGTALVAIAFFRRR